MNETRRTPERAAELLDEALELQKLGSYGEAIEYYHRSIEACPTPEAHTYLGWALGSQGRFDEAIVECERAITLDPDFGNPYNDIGSYLLHLERPDDAITWLIRAKVAARYETPEHAYCNMGKAYEMKRLWPLALDEYEAALRLNPAYIAARVALDDLSALRN